MLNNKVISTAKNVARGFLLLLSALVLTFSHISALSPEQIDVYKRNVHYFDVACNTEATTTEASPSIGGDLQQLAKDMLKNNNITYWTNAPDGAAPDWQDRVPKGGNTTAIDTRDVVRALAAGTKAYTTADNAPNKYADLNPNILKFIIDASSKGGVMVNALTDKTHTLPSSNHYKGLAVDLDENTQVPIDELIQVADKYGGVKNSETGHHHFDFVNQSKTTDSPSTTGDSSSKTSSTSPTSTIQNIYMVGDSIGVGLYDTGFINVAKKEGWTLKMDVSGGRGMSYPGSEPRGSLPGQNKSGLDAIKADAETIKDSDTVVVELGTNETNPGAGENKSAALFKNEVEQATDSIKKINSDANIYWVNQFGLPSKPYTPWVKAYNDVVDEVAKSKDFTVIDTTSAGISLADGTHPDPNGYKELSNTIVDALKNNEQATTAQPDTCCPEGSASGEVGSLVGRNNVEQAFNFFVQQGLTPEQSAGVVGNLVNESGVEPSTGGSPSAYAFGIAQWTPGSKFSLDKDFNHITGSDTDLLTQLQVLWAEMNGKSKAGFTVDIVSGISKFDTPGEAADYFRANFERCDVSYTSCAIRAPAAEQVFDDFGGGATSAGSSSGGCGTSSTSSDISGYDNPLRDVEGLFKRRIDQGVDYGGHGPVYAIGPGKVTHAATSGTGWPGDEWVSYQLTEGPAKGKFVYFAESCTPKVKEGDEVDSQTVICDMHGDNYPWIETGWAADGTTTSAAAHDVYRECATSYGQNFSDLLEKLGAPPGVVECGGPDGTLPKDWPTW